MNDEFIPPILKSYVYTIAKVFGFKKYSDSHKNCTRIRWPFTQEKPPGLAGSHCKTKQCFFYLRMDVNPLKFHWKLPWTTEKFLSILCLLQLLIKEIVPPLATSATIHEKEKNFYWALALLIQSIQILLQIRVYPDSWGIRRLSIPDLLLQCKRLIWIRRKSLRIPYESGEIWCKRTLGAFLIHTTHVHCT